MKDPKNSKDFAQTGSLTVRSLCSGNSFNAPRNTSTTHLRNVFEPNFHIPKDATKQANLKTILKYIFTFTSENKI